MLESYLLLRAIRIGVHVSVAKTRRVLYFCCARAPRLDDIGCRRVKYFSTQSHVNLIHMFIKSTV